MTPHTDLCRLWGYHVRTGSSYWAERFFLASPAWYYLCLLGEDHRKKNAEERIVKEITSRFTGVWDRYVANGDGLFLGWLSWNVSGL